MKKKKARKKERISNISLLHYYKLVFRSLLFLIALVLYIFAKINPQDFKDAFQFTSSDLGGLFNNLNYMSVFLIFVWIFEIFEMVLRFFPSRFESMGCQKQFKRNYIPREGAAPAKHRESMRGVLLTAVLWCTLIGVFGVFHFLFPTHFDQGILLLICLIFSICDMICILFFCPFHTWFMKNKCCGSCRIYNWDYFMMFSPLIFVPSWYTYTLFFCSLLLLIRWEVTAAMHPERFLERTNEALTCANCPEKLCHHKRQLRRYLKKYHALARTVVNEAITTIKDRKVSAADESTGTTPPPLENSTSLTDSHTDAPSEAPAEVSVGSEHADN